MLPMPTVVAACCLLVVLSSVLHYEVLRGLNVLLPRLAMPRRTLLLVVILGTFLAHAAEMGLYGLGFHLLTQWLPGNALAGSDGSFSASLYFSAETFTSLGFGDLTPRGPVRLLAGVEALNGLLLIGWSASFTYLCMQQFWSRPAGSSDTSSSRWH